MSIFDQALALGKGIADTREYAEMQAAENAVKGSPGALQVVKDYQDLQQSYYKMQMAGQKLTEEHLKKLTEAENEAMSNNVVKDYYDTRMKFHQVVEKVNSKIQEGITGVDPDSCGCGCGGNHG
ncbi:MAG: YlbF family regulator [Actinobacteria bacterium]|nr:YlbF family regulator [Actinomycetota bacterium]